MASNKVKESGVSPSKLSKSQLKRLKPPNSNGVETNAQLWLNEQHRATRTELAHFDTAASSAAQRYFLALISGQD